MNTRLLFGSLPIETGGTGDCHNRLVRIFRPNIIPSAPKNPHFAQSPKRITLTPCKEATPPVIGKINPAPRSDSQEEGSGPDELSTAMNLRDEWMKQGGSVRADYTTVVDGDRRYVEVSDSFCQLVGYSREELIGKRYDDLTAPSTNDIPTVFRLFVSQGYMHGLWMLMSHTGIPILVRYESWVRSDCYIQAKMEVIAYGDTRHV
jgi:PAS domain-containing protein